MSAWVGKEARRPPPRRRDVDLDEAVRRAFLDLYGGASREALFATAYSERVDDVERAAIARHLRALCPWWHLN